MKEKTKKKILLALGSPSDAEKLLSSPSVGEIVEKKPSSIELVLSIASAHRSPEMIIEHANYESLGSSYIEVILDVTDPVEPGFYRTFDVIIGAAGLSNALISAYMAEAHMNPERTKSTIFIGLPVSDSRSKGVSSLLSTQEMPPGCPVGCVGVDNINSALGLAFDIACCRYDEVVVLRERGFDEAQTRKLTEKLDSLEVRHRYTDTLLYLTGSGFSYGAKGNSASILLVPYIALASIEKIDSQMSQYNVNCGAKDIAIASCFRNPDNSFFYPTPGNKSYLEITASLERTMHVRFGGIENMALLAAKIIANTTEDYELKKKIDREFKKGLEKYNAFKTLISIESAADLAGVLSMIKK